MGLDFEQQGEAPLYPKILWNRPLSRHGAGRLLVIGGHRSDFSQSTAAYSLAIAAGAGECSVAMPDSLSQIVGPNAQTTYLPSSPSGSIGREAVGTLLHLAGDADTIVLGANLSNNSETAIAIERLLQETDQPVVAFDDLFMSLQFNLQLITERSNALIVATMPEVFKLSNRLQIPIRILRDGGISSKVEIARAVRKAIKADLVIYGTETIVASEEQVSVTPTNPVLTRLPVVFPSVLSVFWLQHRKQPYQALTTAAWVLAQAGKELNQQELPMVGLVAKSIAHAIDYEA